MESRFVYPLYYYGLLDGSYSDKFLVCCPFHQETKPSMLIDLENETFKCFGCDQRGSLTELVMKLEGIDFFQATKKIHMINKDKPLPLVYERAAKPTHTQAIETAKQYFHSIEETDWIAEESEAALYMIGRGFDLSTLTRLNIKAVHCNTYGILIPLYDNGKFRGFAKRAINEQTLPKYRYNVGLSRSNLLVGDYFKDWVVLVEGTFDWIKLRQFHVRNCCAILGWSISDNQISKLQQVTDKVVCALDATETGNKGYMRLKQYFDVVRFQYPHDVKDLGDMNQNQFNRAKILTNKMILKYERKSRHG